MTDNSPSAFILLSLRYRKVIAAFAVIGASIGLLASLLQGKQYQSSTTFIIQDARSLAGGFAGLANQLGVSVPSGGFELSPEFYRDLATSRVILEPLLAHPVTQDETSNTVPLLELLEIEGETAAEREAQGIEWLRESAIGASTDRETGVVRINATTESAALSHSLATAIISEIKAFDLSSRRTQARAEREFLQSRVDSAWRDLAQLEAELQSFLIKNRSYQNSPELQVQRDRLQRGVMFRQEVLSNLAQAFEQARIEEVRNRPAITVLEPPLFPVTREPRGTVVKSVAGLLAGAVAGFLLALATASIRQARGPNWSAIRSSWAELRGGSADHS